MGSFNTTCFASNQTIASGDNCHVLPILQQSTFDLVTVTLLGKTEQLFGIANSNCYSDCFWRPAGSWIPATYDDYGRVQLQLDALTRNKLLTFFLGVYKNCPQVVQGDNPCHDLPFDFPSFLREKAPDVLQVLSAVRQYEQSASVEGDALDEELTACWDYVFEVAAKNRLFMRDASGKKLRPLQFAMLHDRAFDSLIALVSATKGWDDESYEPEAFLQRTFDGATAASNERLELSTEEDPTRTGLMKNFLFASSWREGLSRLDVGNNYPRAMETGMTHRLCEKLAAGVITKEEFFEAFKPLLRDRYVLAGLNSMNLRISPMVYAGQDYSNSEGAAYAQFVATVSKGVTKDRKTQQYGEFLSYSVQAPSREAFDAFVEELGQSDSDADDLVYEELTGSLKVNVTFSSPSDLEHLEEVISRLPYPALMLETLKAR